MPFGYRNEENDLSELKYEYDKAMRLKDSLQKNLDRRKKLGLADKAYERQLLAEIADIEAEMNDLKKQIRAIESVKMRSQNISDSGIGFK